MVDAAVDDHRSLLYPLSLHHLCLPGPDNQYVRPAHLEGRRYHCSTADRAELSGATGVRTQRISGPVTSSQANFANARTRSGRLQFFIFNGVLVSLSVEALCVSRCFCCVVWWRLVVEVAGRS